MCFSVQTEMMSDAIDDAIDNDEAEEETDELTNQVLFKLPFIPTSFFKKKLMLQLCRAFI